MKLLWVAKDLWVTKNHQCFNEAIQILLYEEAELELFPKIILTNFPQFIRIEKSCCVRVVSDTFHGPCMGHEGGLNKRGPR